MKNNKKTNEKHLNTQEDDIMNATVERYCTISESLIESCKEVKLMREGKKQKNSLDLLWNKIEKWNKEDDEVGK